jgi:hypothetical protein
MLRIFPGVLQEKHDFDVCEVGAEIDFLSTASQEYKMTQLSPRSLRHTTALWQQLKRSTQEYMWWLQKLTRTRCMRGLSALASKTAVQLSHGVENNVPTTNLVFSSSV